MADKLLSLDEVVDIPDFAINHPDVNKNTKIAFFTGDPRNLGSASYNADPSKPIRVIGINTEGRISDERGRPIDPSDVRKKTLLHELQHVLQPVSGGTPFSGNHREVLTFLETHHPRIFVEGSPGVLTEVSPDYNNKAQLRGLAFEIYENSHDEIEARASGEGLHLGDFVGKEGGTYYWNDRLTLPMDAAPGGDEKHPSCNYSVIDLGISLISFLA